MDKFCPIMSFGRVRPRPCNAGCAFEFAEPDALYFNRVETALEHGDLPPERGRFCALVVVAEAVVTGGPGFPGELTELLNRQKKAKETTKCCST